MTSLGSVLLVRLSALGDVLFALPALEALAASGRAARIGWVVEDKAAALLARHPALDDVVVFPRRTPGAWLGFAAALRARRDDVVVDLQANFKSRMQLMCMKAPRKVGLDGREAKEGAERALTQRVSLTPDCRHRVDRNLAVVAALGVDVPTHAPRPTFPLDEESRARAEQSWHAWAPHGPRVVLHPGTSAFGKLKRWAPERFGALARALATSHDARCIVTGSPDERALVDRSVAASRGAARADDRSRSLDDFLALVAAADIVVASDSMPLHAANLLGTRVVALYGPKDPAVTGPYWDGATVVRSGVDCSPCTLRRCADVICMDELQVGTVVAATRAALESQMQ